MAALAVGTLFFSSSGSTIGRAWAGRLAMVGGLLCVLHGMGCRSWMWTWGAVGLLAVMIDGMASTLGVDGGFVGWFATQCGSGRADGFLGLPLGGRLGGSRRGLQLLAITVLSSSLSSKARI